MKCYKCGTENLTNIDSLVQELHNKINQQLKQAEENGWERGYACGLKEAAKRARQVGIELLEKWAEDKK